MSRQEDATECRESWRRAKLIRICRNSNQGLACLQLASGRGRVYSSFRRDSRLPSVNPPERVPTIRGISKRHWPTNPAPVAGFVFSGPASWQPVPGKAWIVELARAVRVHVCRCRRCELAAARRFDRFSRSAGIPSIPRRVSATSPATGWRMTLPGSTEPCFTASLCGWPPCPDLESRSRSLFQR